MEGTPFGRYRLIEVIGQGGMGKVFRAYDPELEREVAIKVLPGEVAAQPGYRERFRREARVAARLIDPHVIPIFESGEIDGQLYLVMPVISGVDLGAVLKSDGPMPLKRAVRVIEQLAEALDTAHAAGLVHRDVKPSNALITSRGNVYLIDFGIAHDAAATKLTHTGGLLGSPAYMAPERFSAGKIDARGDVYSLTCVLYECLTGQHPYPADTLEQQITAHLTQPPPRPSQHRPDVPAAFDEVVARGMSKNPAQRYQTAPELAAAASQALTTPNQWSAAPQHAPLLRPLHAQPPAPLAGPADAAAAPTVTADPGLASRPRSRRPWLVGAGAAAAAVLIVAVVVAVIGLQPSLTASTARRTSPQSMPTSTAPMVAPEGLDSILLTAQDVNTVMGASGMQPTAPINHAFRTGLPTLSNPNCLSAFFVATTLYEESGFSGISHEELQEPAPGTSHTVGQVAASFTSAALALAFVKASADRWLACAGQTITQTDNGHDTRWTLGNLVGDAPQLEQLKTFENGYACQHVLRAVLNVVLEVAACGSQISDAAVRIADKMAAAANQQAH